MRRDVFGFHGIEQVRKGDVLDLEPSDVLRYLKIGLVEIPYERRIHIPGMRIIEPDNPVAADIARLQKQLEDEDAKRPKQPAERVRGQVTGRYGADVSYLYPVG